MQFLAINSSSQDSFVSVSAHAQERDVPFPVLKDFDQKVADAFGAKRTPEVFLLDANRVIRYHGRIDDQYGVGFRRDKPTRSDLEQALDELLAGQPITTPRTEASGCPIERSRKPARRQGGDLRQARRTASSRNAARNATGRARSARSRCLTFEDAKKRTSRIREAVLEERMPPWHADPRHGKFANDRRLTQDERDTLLAWIDTGAPKGDDKDLPPPLTFVKGWKIGEPDKVFTMAEEFKVPATGVLDYQRFVVDPGFKDDVWVQAAECRPGNRKVVHHILVYILAPGRRDPYDRGRHGGHPGRLGARRHAGHLFARTRPGAIPAGSKLLFEVHYTPERHRADRPLLGRDHRSPRSRPRTPSR